PTRLQLGDRGIEVVDCDAVVVPGRVDARTRRRRPDEMELLIADGVPVPVDPRDIRTRLVAEPEHVAVERDHVVERRAVRVHRHVMETRDLHESSCSMNSSRMPPGASTNAIRRLPNVPSTTAGPQTTV